MDVHYDRGSDLFWVEGKEVFWSSIYVLRQHKASFKDLCRRLKVSKDERHMFREELDDLRALGLIHGRDAITTTKKGIELLREVEKHMSFAKLRQHGVHDIDEVTIEANRLESMDPRRTRLLVRGKPWHEEHVEWFSLFVNTAGGFFAFFMLILAFFFAMGDINMDGLIVQGVFAPIGAIMFMGTLTMAMWVFYHGGAALGYLLFRHK